MVPPTVLYRPGTHSVQERAPAGMYDPAAQSPLHAVSPVWSWYWPLGHAAHIDKLTAALNVPAAHGRHAVLPDASVPCPAEQFSMHDVCPSWCWNVPGGHVLQYDLPT